MPKNNSELKDPREWVEDLDIESTEDIAVPKMLVDQVIGQEQGVEIVRKASEQKRHVMLIGCLLYTSPSPRDGLLSRMPSSA